MASPSRIDEALGFNPAPPARMHIDINSCFATIEQQANPLLRGRPVAVAAYTTPSGCIVAPSIEAKTFGVKTGMRVKDGRILCPGLIVLPPDPNKYRYIHLALRRLLGEYTDRLTAASIDEFSLNLAGCPALRVGIVESARQIKRRITAEVGDWLRVSIGISTNRWLAKQAAGLRKPDGLDVIDASNYREVYAAWELTDLKGINVRLAARLHAADIHTVTDMAAAESWELRSALHSILGHQWYVRLRGWEADDVEFPRRSYGAAYALPEPLSGPEQLAPILAKLIEKATGRMRAAGYHCHGVSVAVDYRDGNSWQERQRTLRVLAESREVTRRAYLLLTRSPHAGPVRSLSVALYDLTDAATVQAGLFDDTDDKRLRLVAAVDGINQRYGPYTCGPATLLLAGDAVQDRISFGTVGDLDVPA